VVCTSPNALATLFITAVTIGVIVVNRMTIARERRRPRRPGGIP